MANQVIDVEENDDSLRHSARRKAGEASRKNSDPYASTTGQRDVPTRRNWRWIPWLGIVVGAFAVGRWWSTREEHAPLVTLEGVKLGTVPHGDALVVTAEPVQARPIQRTVDAVGTLHGFEELVISSKLEGRVARIHHDLSSVVKPGDVLLELDETDARLAVDQAERSLQAELSKWGFAAVPVEGEDLSGLPTVVSAKQKFDLAKSRLDRMLPLESTKSISTDDLEQAKSDVRVLESDWKNQLLMAQSAAATARLRAADLAIAKQRLVDCQICVPNPTLSDRSGDHIYTVSERLVSEGTLLRPGTELFRLVLGSTLKLRLSVPEIHASKIEVGQTVMVSTSSHDAPRPGHVAKISPSVDRATRTFIVEVQMPNEDRRCKPGSFAKAKILVGAAETAQTIPVAGLYSLAGVNKLFLFEDGVACEYPVQLGQQTKDWVEIVSPRLPEGARVITSGQRMLSDRVPVVERPVPAGVSEASIPAANAGQDSSSEPVAHETASNEKAKF
jgi:RND family efflux transporter MFP subunit